jgi:hypothetical protein
MKLVVGKSDRSEDQVKGDRLTAQSSAQYACNNTAEAVPLSRRRQRRIWIILRAVAASVS